MDNGKGVYPWNRAFGNWMTELGITPRVITVGVGKQHILKSRMYHALMAAKEHAASNPPPPGTHFNESEAAAHTTADVQNQDAKFAKAKAVWQYDEKCYSIENWCLYMYDANMSRTLDGVQHPWSGDM